MTILQRFWRHVTRRRDHEPRLWPIALVDYDTREVRYELGEWNMTVGRAVIRW